MPSAQSAMRKLLSALHKKEPEPLFRPLSPDPLEKEIIEARKQESKGTKMITVTHDHRLPEDITLNTSTKEFRGEVLTLIKEWDEFTTYLAYRHMVAYYQGLGEWRNHNYQSRSVPFPDDSPCGLPHRIRQELRGLIGRVRATDKVYYDIQCASYRHEQRKHKAEYFRSWRDIESRYIKRVGAREARNMQQWARGHGFLRVYDLFDDNMEVPNEVERLEAKYDPERHARRMAYRL